MKPSTARATTAKKVVAGSGAIAVRIESSCRIKLELGAEAIKISMAPIFVKSAPAPPPKTKLEYGAPSSVDVAIPAGRGDWKTEKSVALEYMNTVKKPPKSENTKSG